MANSSSFRPRYLLFAPLLYSFLQSKTLSPVIALDFRTNDDNPLLFFSGYLASIIVLCLIALFCRRACVMLRKLSVATPLLLLTAGVVLVYLCLLGGSGAFVLLFLGGLITGLVTAWLFLVWCEVISALPARTRLAVVSCACALASVAKGVTSLCISGPEASLAATFLAVFLSALPLERLRMRGNGDVAVGAATTCRDDASEFSVSRGVRLSQLRALTKNGWQVLAVTCIAYMITGFAWGNSLFGEFEYFDLTGPLVSCVGDSLGVALFYVCCTHPRLSAVRRWLLPGSVGLLLAGWLIMDALSMDALQVASVATDMAGGIIGASVLAWACDESHDKVAAWAPGSLACLSVTLPIAFGIAISPAVHGVIATLVAPLFMISYLVAFRAFGSRNVSEGHQQEKSVHDFERHLEGICNSAALSPREREVFLMLVHGYTSGYMAEALGISPHTVKTHVKHIYAKVGVHTKDGFLSLVSRLRQSEETGDGSWTTDSAKEGESAD